MNNTNHPRYNTRPNAKFQRSMLALLRAVEAMQAGQSIVVRRHANGLDIAPMRPEKAAEQPKEQIRVEDG